jgi:peptidyl-prolyl cis-trans isomerase D
LFKGLVRVSLPVAREESFSRLLSFNGLPMLGLPEGPARRLYVHDRKTGKFDSKNFKSQMRRLTNMTMTGFTEHQKAEALAARVRAVVRARTRVSDAEARAAYSANNEKAVVNYVKLEEAFLRAHVVDASKVAIAAWSKENTKTIDEAWQSAKDRYTPGCRSVRHILVRIDRAAKDKDAAEKAARDKIASVRKRLTAGVLFTKVAASASEDDLTASRGGKLGCFAAGKLAKPNTAKAIDDAAYALKKGKISDVVSTNYGLHIVKLDAIHNGKAALDVGRREVRRDLFLRKEAERLAAEGAKQIHAAVKAGKSLEDALEAYLSATLSAENLGAGNLGEGKSKAARQDERRPQIKKSEPFTKLQPAFSEVQQPGETAAMVFALDKPGAVTRDVVKLYSGFGVLTLAERIAIDDKQWQEKRRESIENMRADKQRDSLVAYVQRLRKAHATDLRIFVRLGDDKAKGDKPSDTK